MCLVLSGVRVPDFIGDYVKEDATVMMNSHYPVYLQQVVENVCPLGLAKARLWVLLQI